MSIIPSNPATLTAVALYPVPHFHTLPSSSSATVLFVPTAALTMPVNSSPVFFITCTGSFFVVAVPSPNKYDPLYPNPHTVPSCFTHIVL